MKKQKNKILVSILLIVCTISLYYFVVFSKCIGEILRFYRWQNRWNLNLLRKCHINFGKAGRPEIFG